MDLDNRTNAELVALRARLYAFIDAINRLLNQRLKRP